MSLYRDDWDDKVHRAMMWTIVTICSLVAIVWLVCELAKDDECAKHGEGSIWVRGTGLFCVRADGTMVRR